MQKIIVCKGLQASGKSTWALNEVARNKGKYKRVNKDDLRAMLDAGEWSKSNETFLLKVQEQIVSNALRDGKDVIIDDTNFDDKHFRRMCTIAQSSGRDVMVFEKYFPVDLKLAIERDSKRAKPVGENIIRTYYNKYIKNQIITEKNEIFYGKSFPTFEIDPKLTNVIICDLDGTLALLNGRSPYDASACENDIVNKPVLETLMAMWERGYDIIFVSGREDKYEEQTKRFLDKHLVDQPQEGTIRYTLFMRKSGDQRPDNVIKQEIFEEHIRGKFNVLYVIDDRPKVIRMWRELGLTVYQLNDVEF